MPGELIDPVSVARFRADVARLVDPPPAPDKMLGLAVSGGSDSLAMLLLAHAAWPGAIAAATVDHELRAEAAGEAQWVGRLCDDLDVPHVVLRAGPRYDASAIANLQDRARSIRYFCLDRWASQAGIGHVAVAHQRDDVAETFLMRAARGAGVRSLAALPATRTLDFATTMLVRPLLTWSREELAAIVAASAIVPVDDPSNADPRFDRTRYRRLLTDNAELDPAMLARTATNLRDVEEAVEWMVLRDLRARFEEGEYGDLWLLADNLPFELKRRFVLRAIESVRNENGIFDGWRATAVPDLVRALDAGRGGTIANVQARVVKGRWHFRPAPPRRAR